MSMNLAPKFMVQSGMSEAGLSKSYAMFYSEAYVN
jgi:hypothetical protein